MEYYTIIVRSTKLHSKLQKKIPIHAANLESVVDLVTQICQGTHFQPDFGSIETITKDEYDQRLLIHLKRTKSASK